MPLKFDAMVPAQPLRQAAELGRRAAEAGLSGLVVTEAGRTAYLTCGAIATAADIDVLTGIAVAFPRSPMVTAATAWELAEASGGRFRLGLGHRCGPTSSAATASAFDHPGPRLREYVLAVKQIFESFRTGAPLAVEGEFYNLSLLPPMWAPGPIDCADPPVDVAAVSPWMLRMAGEVADGVHVHPLNTPTYLRETLLPNLEAGAARSGRRVEDLEVIVPAFLVVGDTGNERAVVARAGPRAGGVLRVDAQLRLHLRAARPRGHDRPAARAPAGRRRGGHGGRDRRRPPGELHHRGHVGRHRRQGSSPSTAASPPGSSATSPASTSSRIPRRSSGGARWPGGQELLSVAR